LKVSIRFQEGSDVPVDLLRELYQHAPWAEDRTASDIREMLQQTDLVLSAWDGTRLVGFGRALTDRVYRAILYDIIVHPDYQRQGLGRELVERLLNHPLLAKVPVISLFTRDKQSFYDKFGFVTEQEKGLTGMILVRGGEVYRETKKD
jgi:ribosomal protein S18 acetylase RimI-like enzyme